MPKHNNQRISHQPKWNNARLISKSGNLKNDLSCFWITLESTVVHYYDKLT